MNLGGLLTSVFPEGREYSKKWFAEGLFALRGVEIGTPLPLSLSTHHLLPPPGNSQISSSLDQASRQIVKADWPAFHFTQRIRMSCLRAMWLEPASRNL